MLDAFMALRMAAACVAIGRLRLVVSSRYLASSGSSQAALTDASTTRPDGNAGVIFEVARKTWLRLAPIEAQ